MKHVAAIAIIALCSCSSATDSGPALNSGDARIITEDIARFWNAFDQIASANDTMPLRRDYLNPGTTGLRDLTDARWRNARNLTTMVWPLREYYASIRSNTLNVAALEPEIRAIYRKLENMYADAVFPDIYFVIGGMSTGGTTSRSGLLIGTELFSKAASSPIQTLNPWQRSVVRSTDILPVIVAHELAHYQQRSRNNQTLLAQSVTEGSADFVSELLTGRTISEHLEQYGSAHEAELWNEFKVAMNGTDVSRWLYNGGTVTDSTTRPADLGYFIGKRIAQAYYNKTADKNAALRDIFAVTDFPAFLTASGYGSQF